MTDDLDLPTTLPEDVTNTMLRPFPGIAISQGIDEALKALPPNKDLIVFAYADREPGGTITGKLGVAYRVTDQFSFMGDLEKKWTPGPDVDPLTWRVAARWTP